MNTRMRLDHFGEIVTLDVETRLPNSDMLPSHLYINGIKCSVDVTAPALNNSFILDNHNPICGFNPVQVIDAMVRHHFAKPIRTDIIWEGRPTTYMELFEQDQEITYQGQQLTLVWRTYQEPFNTALMAVDNENMPYMNISINPDEMLPAGYVAIKDIGHTKGIGAAIEAHLERTPFFVKAGNYAVPVYKII